jgi:phytoene dehydrogenase-like protein
MNREPDVAVIGSGPNGLVAACVLARLGYSVLVLEAHPRRPGGALGSEELTLPGFVHDVGAAFFPMRDSRAFAELDLGSAGLSFRGAASETCHPALDGSYAAIAQNPELSRLHFGEREDGECLVAHIARYRQLRERFDEVLLGPPSVLRFLSLGPRALLHIGPVFASSGGGFARRTFASEAARRVLPALAMHVALAPSDRFGAAMGYVLAMSAALSGFEVPVGGAQSITNALVTILERHGGSLRLASRVTRVLVSERRARGVLLEDGTEISVKRGVLADTALSPLLLDLVGQAHLPLHVVRRVEKLKGGPGTFKLDWALSRPVPWTCEIARQSAVVHTGESIEDLEAHAVDLRRGVPSERYLVIGQQSLCDPSRAPAGQHTLYCYTRVPSDVEGGWSRSAESFADRIEQRIEALAPGFRSSILARRVTTPRDFEETNANLQGGDIGGGDNAWTNQLVFRPTWAESRYALPVRGLYLCSSYTHPGAGVHGMCGYNAALRAAREIG